MKLAISTKHSALDIKGMSHRWLSQYVVALGTQQTCVRTIPWQGEQTSGLLRAFNVRFEWWIISQNESFLTIKMSMKFENIHFSATAFCFIFWGHHLGPYISYRFFENTNFRFCWIVICWDIQFVVIWFWLIKISSAVHICIWIVVCNSKISILVRFVFHRDSLVVTAAPQLTSTGNLRQQEEGNNTQSVKFRILLLKFKNIIQILWRSKTM